MRPVGLAATVLVVLTVGAVAASGAAAAPQAYYLALGDSIGYGYQPSNARKQPPPSSYDKGYVDVLAARLRPLAPAIKVVNYSCPGESIVSFAKGGCPWLQERKRLHSSFRGTQQTAALAFLKAHPGQVSPITITLWGNDVVALQDACQGKLACVKKRGPAAVAAMTSRLGSILRKLRAAAPAAEIIATGAWNFEVDRLKQAAFFYRDLDKRIAEVAAGADARVADIRAVFNPPGSFAAQRSKLCSLTYLCSLGDPHPKNAGYRVMADAFFAASGYAAAP